MNMKRDLTIMWVTLVASAVVCLSIVIPVIRAYEKYVRASEELLHEVETLCVNHDIDWGDTICEGDAWCDYIDARINLDLGYFEHR